MNNYSKLILAIMLCLQPALSVSMSSGVDSPIYGMDCVYGTIAACSYGAFVVSRYFKQDHETRHRSLLRGEVDKKTAKALMKTPEAQRLIKDLRVDHQKRKQEFFLAKSRESTLHILTIAQFDKALEDRCVSDHASRIIDFLALSEKEFAAQGFQLKKMHYFEQAGLRHRIVDEATKKERAQHAQHRERARFFLAAASGASSVSYYYHTFKS